MPIAHVEESWQMAEFYNNKVPRYVLQASSSPLMNLDYEFVFALH